MQIEMLNKAPEGKGRMVFNPRILTMQPGDTVTFLATDKGHNAESIKDGIPDGAEAWKGKINEEVSITLSTPGFYCYKCKPHEASGMVGLIIVEGEGKLANLEAAKSIRSRGRAKKIWEEIWAEADAEGLTA
ncbi:MAG: pseudoazurin [Pseudomonadota bacterium]